MVMMRPELKQSLTPCCNGTLKSVGVVTLNLFKSVFLQYDWCSTTRNRSYEKPQMKHFQWQSETKNRHKDRCSSFSSFKDMKMQINFSQFFFSCLSFVFFKCFFSLCSSIFIIIFFFLSCWCRTLLLFLLHFPLLTTLLIILLRTHFLSLVTLTRKTSDFYSPAYFSDGSDDGSHFQEEIGKNKQQKKTFSLFESIYLVVSKK